jgi:hypothetical protein
MAGESDLAKLLASLSPELMPGEFVMASVDAERAASLPAHAVIRESEGVTVILAREDADAAHLDYDFVARWITLTVHSSLDAVGMTAAFAAALTREGISCNVIAGFFHDHLLVPADRADDAVRALRALATRS